MSYTTQNLSLTYCEVVKCYAELEAQFEVLSCQEILEYLHHCVNYFNDILFAENSENNMYFLTIANLKHQALVNISQIEMMNKSNFSVTKGNLKKATDSSTKFTNIVEDTKVKPRTKGLCDIAGLDDIKNILRTFIISPMKQPQLYEGLKLCNCFLLFGPPGTGKTKLVDAIAAEAGAMLLSVTASTLLSQYVGQSEKMLRSLFQYISSREDQIILFIDEIDGLCRHRIQDESDHTRRLKTEFMCQLSNFENSKKAYVVCATNCPWELDIAFIRRFQKRLYVPLPNSNERSDLLKLCTQNTSLEHTLHSWGPVVKETEGFSGSDIVQLVQHALTIPIVQLHQNNMWKCVNGYYEALPLNESFDSPYTYHCHYFNDLPPNSVKARKSSIDDLIQALKEVRRTISDEDIKKYEWYMNKCGKNSEM